MPWSRVAACKLNISAGTNDARNYTINIPAARMSGQNVAVRARAVRFRPTTSDEPHEWRTGALADVRTMQDRAWMLFVRETRASSDTADTHGEREDCRRP